MKQAKSYFELLGLPQTFGLDSTKLEEVYRALSQVWHPDRFPATSVPERTQILLRAAELNQAYRTLKDENQRAAYLLKLYQAQFAVDLSQLQTPADAEFLAEMLDLQEALEEARLSQQQEALDDLLLKIHHQADALKKSMVEGFARLEGGDAKSLSEVSKTLSQLRFYQRLLENVALEENEI